MTATATNLPLASIALTMTADAMALRTAGEATGKAQTAYARSTLAAIATGVSSLAFAEAQLIGVYGAPKDSKGKAVKSASGLRDVDGGFAAYQAFRIIRHVADNIDTDAPATITPPEGEAVSVGTGAIRALVVSFALGESGLRGLSGLKGAVDALVTAHANAVAKAMGVAVESDDKGEGNGDKGTTDAPVSLLDAATAMLLRVQNASDVDFAEAQAALAALSDYIDSRWAHIADATNAPELQAVNG